MFARVIALVEEVKAVAAEIDPHALTPAEAAGLIELLGTVTRVSTAGMTVLAARSTGGTAWRKKHGDVQAWFAEHAGLGYYDAKRLVDCSYRVDRNPGEILPAMIAGTISPLKAAEAASARDAVADQRRQQAEDQQRRRDEPAPEPADDPGPQGQGDLFDDDADTTARPDTSPEPEPDLEAEGMSPEEVEADMMAKAEELELARVRQEAERLKAAAHDQRQRARHQYKARGIWSKAFDDGCGGGLFKATPEKAAEIFARIRDEADQLFEEGRRNGQRHSREAYCLDAFCRLIGIQPPQPPPDDDDEPAPQTEATAHHQPGAGGTQ